MKKVKIVLVGAGSGSFGRAAICDVLGCAELNEKAELDVVLVDVDESALERMLGFAEVLKEYRGVKTRLSATTDRCKAFKDADYVITCVARHRMPLWEQDFYIPHTHGFRHIYGENGGPGAAFHTLRSIHLMIPIIQDLEATNPDAMVLNFTNPESRICLAISKLTRVNAVGICHGTQVTCELTAKMMGRKEEELEFTIGGINHFHWVLGVKDVATGEDLMGALDEAITKDETAERPIVQPLVRFLYKTYGRLTFPVDTHVGEYVGFAYDYVGPTFEKYRKKFEKVRVTGDSEHLPAWKQIQEVADRKVPMSESLAAPTAEAAIPIIQAIELEQTARFVGLNVPNTGPYVTNLPEDCISEVSINVDGDGIHPIHVGALPEGIATMCQLQVAIQNLLVEAYAGRSKRALLAALLLEPTVDSAERAQLMINEMLERQSDYLPEFK